MKIDFTIPITAYELLAIVLSVLALVMPLLRWLYDKYLRQLKIDFLPTGNFTLLFNKSGAYISMGGVYDVKNKPATIKGIACRVIRVSDKAVLPLQWSSFPSPVYRNVAGNYESSFETAHPFRIEADSLAAAFIEFTNAYEKVDESIESILSPLAWASNTVLNRPDIQLRDADAQFRRLPEYREAELAFNDRFFWKAGSYKLHFITYYNESKFTNEYTFEITDDESKRLRENIERILVNPVASRFNLVPPINTVAKKFKEYEDETNEQLERV